ncbi:MAG: DUF3185 family protein [Pseudomonadales bacterium]|nr:DUF3185 family protein [Pseudomonadales bacterium]
MDKRILAVILIVVGVALVAWGYSVYDSAGARISRALDGDTPIEAWIGMVGGVICVAAGIFRLK